ncbi:MMPL/RND family transporter [Mycobacterium sp. C31M]
MSRHDAPTGPIAISPAPHETAHFGKIARAIRTLSVPFILLWVAVAVLLNVLVPQLEAVGEMRSVSMSPDEAPAVIATEYVGQKFQEYESNSAVMIVLEGQDKLGDDSRRYYSELIAKLEADTKHVEHVQDLWSDPLTATGVQSGDGKAVYVQANLSGNQGEALSLESIEAVKNIVESIPAPAGVEVFVTGSAAMTAEQTEASHGSVRLIEALTFVVIITMLLIIFRSFMTMVLMIVMVVVSLLTVRGAVAALGYYEIIGLSTFATGLLVTLAIAISVDYAIFLIGRYQEAISAGESREQAYYTMFGGTAHVIVGSGLTIAGATFCLSFTRLPYFQTLGVPLAVGMLVLIVTAMTFGPAIITVGARFLDPKRANRVRGWRKVGAAVVRWPGAILVTSIAVALIGLLALPGYKTSYNDRLYLPDDISSNQGYAAAERHFSPARLNPEIMMIESDRDLRNPADFLVIEKIAKAMFQVDGIGRVQTITRPDGAPMENTTIPYAISQNSTLQRLNEKYNQDRTADMTKQVAEMQKTIDNMDRMQNITEEMADTTANMVASMDVTIADLEVMRDQIANFDDFFRPFRNYLYWEPHCYNIPICWSLRSVFDVLDGIDIMTTNMNDLMPQMHRLNELMPQMIAIMPEMKATMVSMQQMMLTMQQTQAGMQEQQRIMSETSTEMGKAFNDAMNDDSFYLPAEAFDNPDFAKGLEQFLSPDGHAVRFIINHEGDPMSADGIERIEPLKAAAKNAIKGTPLEGSTIYLGGTAATFKDMADGTKYDLLIAGIAAIGLIFLIMLILTRAIVAAAVIVGTVVLSLGASFGVSVLLWQHLLGIELHWMVLPMAVIILLAVGADYNLLVVSRLKEEIHAGLNTGMIRAMGGSGSTVTAAGMVFAFTMMVMAVSDLTIMGQVGTTIGLGLLFDTLVIRSFMTPSIAALMGKWFWWPQHVRLRPKPQPWPPIQRRPQDALV